MDAYSIIVKPHITEKTMNLIDNNNELAFVVYRGSNKKQIKRAFEELYDESVKSVNTHITSKGIKVAYITLLEENKAEDVAVKLGVF
ncbi:MAG: 50S ribosomal protein L23 [Methanobrevibacter sp.]|jgi:large subunit ribosomal protein L23|nr:50S ribosomal protein L23 [Candidatus Methanoflexus mossambicus]